MSTPHTTVAYPTCGLEERFSELADARFRVKERRTETGHGPAWGLGRFTPGVEKMGDEAGICGVNLDEND